MKEADVNNFFKSLKLVHYIFAFALLVSLVLIAFFAWSYYSYPTCNDSECFFAKLQVCEKVQYTYYGNLTFNYKVKNLEKESCVVEVKLLRSLWREQEFKGLENRRMNCYMDQGKLVYPESDLDKCFGPLKEGLQELIIKKLHKYVLDNLASQL